MASIHSSFAALAGTTLNLDQLDKASQLHDAIKTHLRDVMPQLETVVETSMHQCLAKGLMPHVIKLAAAELGAIADGVNFFASHVELLGNGIFTWSDFAESQPALKALAYPLSREGRYRDSRLQGIAIFDKVAVLYHQLDALLGNAVVH